MQEAQLVLAMMLQRFDFVLDDPSYTLKIRETLTLKPEGLRIRAKARRTAGSLLRSAKPAAPPKVLTPKAAPRSTAEGEAAPLLILYGSNSGSSEAFANRIAGEAPANGYAPTVAAMDDYAANLPKTGAIVVVTASYEGQPSDNARQFVSRGAAGGRAGRRALRGVRLRQPAMGAHLAGCPEARRRGPSPGPAQHASPSAGETDFRRRLLRRLRRMVRKFPAAAREGAGPRGCEPAGGGRPAGRVRQGQPRERAAPG